MMKQRLYKADKIILVLVFALAIYSPLFIGLIQEDKSSSGVERRTLNKLPSIPESIDEFNRFPEAINQYYSDHFGLREALTKAYFKLIRKISSQSAIEDVTFGQNGWLFLGSMKPGYHRHRDPMGDAINVNLFSERELEKFAQSITAVKSWLNGKGIEYIYVIAPNKHSIYFEQLPAYIEKQNPISATDQLVAYLKANTDVMVVDLREPLLEEKKKHQVYYKSDTHWNHYGANIAQFEIMKRIKVLFPGKITPFYLKENQFELQDMGIGDLARMAKLETIRKDTPKPVFESTCTPRNTAPGTKATAPHTMVCDGKTLNTVIFRDSFFTALKPYISRYFHRSTYIWEKLNYRLLDKYVAQEMPDIVIDEVVERTLPYVPTHAFYENLNLP